jgi:cell division protein FtsB
LESNQLPSGYEPPALTDELHPRVRSLSCYVAAVNRYEYNRYHQSYIIPMVMFEKLRSRVPNATAVLKALQDVHTLGLVAFAVIAVLITWSGIKVIETNYGLQKDIARLQQENEVQKLENRNLELKNEYYKTDEYLDLEARKNFGLAAPGETVLVVPKQVAMKYAGSAQVKGASTDVPNRKIPSYERNFNAWLDFLLHRSSNS